MAKTRDDIDKAQREEQASRQRAVEKKEKRPRSDQRGADSTGTANIGKTIAAMQPTDVSAHMPAKHIEDTARLASSVETNKNPSKVRRTKD